MPGDLITFTLALSNSGTDTASGIVVTDIVPSQILMGSFTSTLEITATNTITYSWTVGPLNPGEGGVITLSGQIDPALPDNFSFVNVATVADPDDVTPGNNTSRVFVGKCVVFLPSVSLNWPPVPSTPSLNPIDNAGRYASSTPCRGVLRQTRTLIPCNETPSRTLHIHPWYMMVQPNIFRDDVGATAGIYYYRARANNTWGNHSPWSNSTSTLVGITRTSGYTMKPGRPSPLKSSESRQRDFAPGTYMWLSFPLGTYTLNTWTSQYYYHVTYDLSESRGF